MSQTESLPPTSSVPVRELAPLGDYDTSILSHLGLPFYYRHTPNRQMTRAIIWSSFAGLVILVMWNALYMPYDKDTLMFSIRNTYLGGGGRYSTIEDGAKAIFNQCFVIAMILSGIIAPLFASFSFSSERILGTMEFLRLSPMSTLSIVMGKMFAPVYTLHLISFVLLGVGSAFGLCAGLSMRDVGFASVCIIATTAIFHALGALLAILTTVFRGFGAILFLFLAGWAITGIAVEMAYTRGTNFVCYISPWGMMSNLFWESHRYYNSARGGYYASSGGGSEHATFWGSEGLVLPYVMLGYALVFGMLLWASSRKLEQPERPALPLFKGWIALWAFVVFTAFSIPANFGDNSGQGWDAAATFLALCALGLCTLTIFDHPHQRELVLTEECEAAAGHEKALGASFWRLKHSLLTTGLVLASVMIIFYMGYQTVIIRSSTAATESFWNAAIISCVLFSALAFLLGVILECAWVRFETLRGRIFGGVVIVGLTLALVISFFVQMASSQNHWHQAIWNMDPSYINMRITQSSRTATTLAADGGSSAPAVDPEETAKESLAMFDKALANAVSDPELAQYFEGAKTPDDISQLRKKYESNSFFFFWDYHTEACLVYIGLTVILVAFLFVFRRRIYSNVRKEARESIQPTAALTTSVAQAGA